MEKLIIAGKTFESRLFLGTGKFPSNKVMGDAIEASGTQMVTTALKRIDVEHSESDDMLRYINRDKVVLLPNTSGVRTAEEAVFAAQIAREALETNWLKLEIHPDPKHLLADAVETLKATEILAKDGFIVLPEIIISQSNVPVVIDAGIGAPSHAAEAMEMGAAAVLVNTAIAISDDPVKMARAFSQAVVAGRTAFEAGLASGFRYAQASSPLTEFLNL